MRYSADDFAKMIDTFRSEIVPYMCENNLSLHETFEDLRTSNDEKYATLSELWNSSFGKTYIKDFMRHYGSRFSPKTLERIKYEEEQNKIRWEH